MTKNNAKQNGLTVVTIKGYSENNNYDSKKDIFMILQIINKSLTGRKTKAKLMFSKLTQNWKSKLFSLNCSELIKVNEFIEITEKSVNSYLNFFVKSEKEVKPAFLKVGSDAKTYDDTIILYHRKVHQFLEVDKEGNFFHNWFEGKQKQTDIDRDRILKNDNATVEVELDLSEIQIFEFPEFSKFMTDEQIEFIADEII